MTNELIQNRGEIVAGKNPAEVLREFIETTRFDSLSLIVDLAGQLDEEQSILDVYADWEMPDLMDFTISNQGSDCFGLALDLQERLRLVGEETHIMPFNTDGLPEESKDLLNDVGHVGLFKWSLGGDGVVIYDPGFAVGNLVELSKLNPRYEHISPDGRKFIYMVDFNTGEGLFEIEADYHDKKEFGFRLKPLSVEELPELQKKYFQIRSKYNYDIFDDGGNKGFGVKVNLLSQSVSLWTNGEKFSINFSDWMKEKERFEEYLDESEVDSLDLYQKIEMVIRRSGQLRMLLVPSIKQEWEDKLNPEVSCERRSWSELHQEGFGYGGVVAFVANGSGKIAMYRVPESREKPYINRWSGQLNTLVETAEGSDGSDGVVIGLPIEEFEKNLSRGVIEEIGVDMDQFKVDMATYREIPYGSDGKGLARTVVLRVDDPSLINQFRFSDNGEGGAWQWYDGSEVLGHDIEPNLRPILDYCLREGLV
jgi:hypothetical protein